MPRKSSSSVAKVVVGERERRSLVDFVLCFVDGSVVSQDSSLSPVRRQGKVPPGEVRNQGARSPAESAFRKSASPSAVSANVSQAQQHGSTAAKGARDTKKESSNADLLADGSSSGVDSLSHNRSLVGTVRDSSSGYGSSVSLKSSSTSLSLQDRKQQQLKLINDKLAKRHSNLPWKDTPTVQPSGISKQANSSVEAVSLLPNHLPKGQKSQELSPKRVVEGERREIEVAGLAVKGSPKSPVVVGKAAPSVDHALSQELPGRPVAWKPTPFPMTTPSSKDNGIQTGAFSTQDPLPNPIQGAVLESETSFLPIFPSTFAEQAFCDGEASHAPEIKDSDVQISSLLSSLHSAYGYSSLGEKSRLLSSLVGGEGVGEGVESDAESSPTPPEPVDRSKEVVKIQSAYRGYQARKEYKKHARDMRAAMLIQAAW